MSRASTMLALAITLHLALLTETWGNVIVYTQETPHVIMEEFRDMPASFGNDLPPEGLRGYLLPGEPSDGCDPLPKPPATVENFTGKWIVLLASGTYIHVEVERRGLRGFLVAGEPSDGCAPLPKPPATVENFTGKWFVLLARYNCSFEVKVRNAQAAGYDCAIVHNVNSSDLETMSAKNSEGIEIPSVFVSDIAGVMLAEEFVYTNGFYIMVNGDLPFNINTHLLLPFAIVVVLCLLVILVFLIVKCIKDRRRARRHRLPSRALKKIPTCKFSKGDPYETCAICLDDYQEGERLRVLPCAHAYHAVCIDPWLTQNKRVCPVCKRRVFAAGERRRVHSDSDSTDTEPLLNDHAATQGGTFEEQPENPFVRAARFMTRLRANMDNNAEVAPTEDNNETPNVNDDVTMETGDRAALLPTASAVPTVGVTSERRARRSRRARSASAHAPPSEHVAPLVVSDSHSINTETQGEIGVAALPAQQSSSTPHHIDL